MFKSWEVLSILTQSHTGPFTDWPGFVLGITPRLSPCPWPSGVHGHNILVSLCACCLLTCLELGD